MPYIGKAPNQGVRTRFIYQATAGQTSFSGSDANANVLSYSDGEYVDVYQNGVLLKAGTDYTATTGTSVVLGTGATLNDIVYIKYGTCKKLQNHSLNSKFMKLKEDFEERQNIKRKKDLEQKKETIKKIQKTNKI